MFLLLHFTIAFTSGVSVAFAVDGSNAACRVPSKPEQQDRPSLPWPHAATSLGLLVLVFVLEAPRAIVMPAEPSRPLAYQAINSW